MFYLQHAQVPRCSHGDGIPCGFKGHLSSRPVSRESGFGGQAHQPQVVSRKLARRLQQAFTYA